tara:strand:+ start:277 stop:1365 length:1089 start_codon:yes stop_codon:yes gene_type:complete
VRKLVGLLVDFSQELGAWVAEQANGLQERSVASSSMAVKSPVVQPAQSQTPKLSEAWRRFVGWKDWSEKRIADNQRNFENVLFFVGDRPVGDITKKMLRRAFDSIAKLPQRNLKPYRGKSLDELSGVKVPERYRVSSKTVKEHLKLCQSLFSRYLVQEVDILEQAPTQGLRLGYEDRRFACLHDTEVRDVLEQSKNKPEWFQWFLRLAVYSGARRSEIAGLRGEDFKLCPDTGRYYFLIHSGKTKAARRSVPLHTKLVESGLLDWIGGDLNALLFPTANKNPNRVTDLFGSLIKNKINDVGERVVFHSVRHAFITKSRSAGVETVLVQQVVGHEKTGAGVTDRYTHSFQLRELLSVVDAIDY